LLFERAFTFTLLAQLFNWCIPKRLNVLQVAEAIRGESLTVELLDTFYATYSVYALLCIQGISALTARRYVCLVREMLFYCALACSVVSSLLPVLDSFSFVAMISK